MKKSLLKNLSRTLLVLACCFVANSAWANMWILGEPAGGWAPNNGVQMNQSSDNQFWKILYMENGWNFSFTSSLSESSDDWTSMNGGRLCPYENDFNIHDGDYTCANYGTYTNNSFNMDGTSGYYTITINSTDRRMEIHPTSIAVAGATNSTQSGQPDVVFGTSWNALDNVMTANGQNYTWTSSQVALNKGDNVEFKVVANGNTWIGSNGNNGNNITCTAPIAGNYVLNVTYTVDGVPQGTLTEVSPATEIATLNDLVSSGVSGNKYTITEKLLAVYKSADNKTVWFKDNDNATDKDMPEGNYNTYEVDLGNNDIWYSAPEYFDQSNWIEVVFPEAVNYGGEYLKNLTGIYTNNNGNPMLTLTTTTWVEDGLGSYTPNLYTPANFAGSQQGYFFVKPKAQEYAQIIYAKIQGNKMVMADNINNITGEFTIDWSMNGGYEPTEGVFTGFNGIIRNAAISPAPRLMSVGGNAVVSPTNLTSENVVTAISTVGVNGEVKNVKYVSVAGMVSDRPFQGVNIVVTEYTDGSRTTAKVVK